MKLLFILLLTIGCAAPNSICKDCTKDNYINYQPCYLNGCPWCDDNCCSIINDRCCCLHEKHCKCSGPVKTEGVEFRK